MSDDTEWPEDEFTHLPPAYRRLFAPVERGGMTREERGFGPEPEPEVKVTRTPGASDTGAGAGARSGTDEGAEAYGKRAISAELAFLWATPEGKRNDQLNVAAFNLSQLVAGGVLDHDATWEELRAMALAVGLTPSETEGTIASGFAGGMRSPRGVPERERPAEVPAVTVLRFPGVTDEQLVPPGEDAEGSPVPRLFPLIDWHELWADETEDEWLVEPVIPARRVVALFSAPKVGKSLLMLEVAVAMSRGRPVLGCENVPPRRVLYVDFENDPRGDVRERLRAMGYGPDDLGELYYLSYPQLAYLDTAMGGATLLEICRYYGIEVVVIDTISRAVGGEENANDTWLGFYRNTGQVLKAEGVTVVRLDHTGKDETKGMRGGSAKLGDVDVAWRMDRVTETTYTLECVANRLPVAEKLMTIHRETEPRLWHRVDSRGIVGAYAARWENLLPLRLDALDAAFGDEADVSAERAIEALKAVPLPGDPGETLGLSKRVYLSRLREEWDRRHGRATRFGET